MADCSIIGLYIPYIELTLIIYNRDSRFSLTNKVGDQSVGIEYLTVVENTLLGLQRRANEGKPHGIILNPYIKGESVIRLIKYNLIRIIRFHIANLLINSDAQTHPSSNLASKFDHVFASLINYY